MEFNNEYLNNETPLEVSQELKSYIATQKKYERKILMLPKDWMWLEKTSIQNSTIFSEQSSFWIQIILHLIFLELQTFLLSACISYFWHEG